MVFWNVSLLHLGNSAHHIQSDALERQIEGSSLDSQTL